MKHKHLLKKADIVTLPYGELNKDTATMFNYLNAAAKHKNIDIPDMRLLTELPGGPAGVPNFDNLDVPYAYIASSTPSAAVLTHEMGHALKGHMRGKGINSPILERLPILGKFITLGQEAQANASSAKMLKDMYGDDPKLLETIYKDRKDTLTPMFRTYLWNTVPAIGTALGLAHGLYTYSKGKKEYNKKIDSIDKLPIPDRYKDEFKSKYKKPSKLYNFVGKPLFGGSLGSLIGAIGMYSTLPYGIKGLSDPSAQFNKDNDVIGMMREHAKRNGYYTEALDTNMSGQTNLTTPVPDFTYQNGGIAGLLHSLMMMDVKQAPLNK